MFKREIKNIFGLALVMWLLSFTGCEKQKFVSGEDGYMKGKITIGPICPVETIPPDPNCLPTAATYKAYPVSVWTIDMSRRIASLLPELNGSYIMELPAGDFRVILEKKTSGIGSSNLPVLVTILPHDSTILNINIDTGIR